jgi:hypothetical protein
MDGIVGLTATPFAMSVGGILVLRLAFFRFDKAYTSVDALALPLEGVWDSSRRDRIFFPWVEVRVTVESEE